jgi:hypothetical protein
MDRLATGRIGRRALLQALPVSALLAAAPLKARSAAKPTGGFDRRTWWKHEYRMLQTNLREIDVRHEPRDIARATRAFGANVLVSNIGGIVAFYPTELPLHHRNPYLRGDFSGDMVRAAHAEGLAYIGRFDLSKALRPAYEAHPDWFMRNRDGRPREYAGTYQACPNGGWAQDYSLQILREGVSRHEVDGLFFNMTGFVRTDYGNVDHGICVCDNCRRRFREMYKLDLPATDDGSDPNWPAYMQFQERVVGELSAKAISVIEEARPGVPLLDFFHGVVARGEVQRRVSRPAPEWAHAMGEQTRWALSISPGRPFSATSAAHIDYPWRQVTESAANHMLRFAQALSTGAKLDLYLMGTLADQDDPRYLEPVSRLFRWHAANERHYEGLTPAARVALYNNGSPFSSGGVGWEKYSTNATRGAYQALVDARIPFWMTDGTQLQKTAGARPYDAIILPHVMKLSDEEAAAIDGFVEAGGLAISTGYSGAFDASSGLRPSQAMRSSPVESFGEPQDGHGWSLDMTAAKLPLNPGRMPIDAAYFTVRPRPGASALLPFAPDQRFGPPEFTYAEPGKPARAAPGVLVKAHGKGHAVHIPWLPDWLYYRDGLDAHRDLFAALIARYAPPPALVLEGPGAMEMTAMRQPSTGKLLVHVVNYTGQRNTRYADPVPTHGLRLGVRTGVSATAHALVAGKTLTGRRRNGDGDHVWFDLPPVEAFEAVQLTIA